MYHKFASLAHEKEFGYAFDSEAFDTKAQVEGHYRMFQTHGDGLCQHSGDWAVTREHMADYLASLAVAVIGNDELMQRVYYELGNRPSIKQIEFAASVLYKEGKTRYFSARELTVSSSSSKQYDKRYQEVRDFHDGSAKSIYRILIPEYADGLMAYAYADAIREWALADNDRPYMEMPACFLEWTQDRDLARMLNDAYTACWDLAQAYQLRNAAETAIENYRRHIAARGEAVQS